MGHANHKQKVKYHIKIKDENAQLKQDLSKARQRLAQLEVGHRGSTFLETLASMSGAADVAEPSVYSTTPGMEPRTPNPKSRRSEVSTRTPDRPASRGAQSARGEPEVCQRCVMQERAVERVHVDFQHFMTLIDRAVCGKTGDRAGTGD